MEEKIIEVMKTIFECEVVDNQTNPDTLDSWDSLRHMNLVSALEEEFDIEFDEDDIVKMLSLEEILVVVTARK